MRVGIEGQGAKGMHKARNLQRAGLLAAEWNRTSEKARTLAAELNVQAPSTLEALGASVDAVVTCVSADSDVLEVVKELAKSLRAGAIVLDSSTVFVVLFC